MADNPLNNLSIRSGVVRQNDIGYILACNPKTEEDDPHVKIFKWNNGSFSDGWANFNAHSVCLAKQPELSLVFLSSSGNYSIHSSTSTSDNIFNNSSPQPTNPRYGDIRSVSEIEGKAYAVGHTGAVYRLDDLSTWTRIDDGLPEDFNIEAIHGFNGSDIYAVGFEGKVWHFDGLAWKECDDMPTNIILNTICCAGDGNVYIGGHKGVLLRGRKDAWGIVDESHIEDDIWNLEWFKGKLYISTLHHVYCLDKDQFHSVEFGGNPPKTCYHLSTDGNVMWSIGEKDIRSFDGKAWTTIV
ncbi:MAG: hypothetical protein GY874_01610 [Desulfobacteraceae bacterium]|nr:hypothetical protein [Desulfobacteraceae bacterium]